MAVEMLNLASKLSTPDNDSMTGEVPVPKEGQKPITPMILDELRVTTDGVIDAMLGVSRSNPDNAHFFVDKEIRDKLDEAAKRAKGALIEGDFEGSSYFYTVTEKDNLLREQQVFKEGRVLPGGKKKSFYGVQRGVEEVVYHENKWSEARYLCMMFDPLYSLYDHNINSYHISRGWENRLHHPFELKEHVDERLGLPIFHMIRGSLGPLHMPLAKRPAE